jgi:DNA-binding LytR/AlgR family response regulator
MAHDPRELLERFRPWQRTFEIGFWIVFFAAQAAINSTVVWMDIQRAHLHFAQWEPVTWEWTSNMVLLALMPALLAFERRFPLHFAAWRRNWKWHLPGSVVYCLMHVGLMIQLREWIYAANGARYQFGRLIDEIPYEYLKDVRAYLGILLTVGLYRLFLLRLQGEASLLDEPDAGPPVEPIERPERFLIRKLGREFLLPAADIEWLQAWGNYVNLRVRGHDYPLRSTMGAIENRLDRARFARVHRSYIVNLDWVAEIEPLDSGDARIKMKDGSYVPCSRRYRDDLRKRAAE